MTRWIPPILMLLAAGCGGADPLVAPQRLDKGLVLILTGIEGQSRHNADILHGLADGGVPAAIEVVDWTSRVPGAYLMNLWSESRNRRRAEEIADRIVRYHMACPGRPVTLVGQSGGGAMAVWIAEALGQDDGVDAIVLLAAALSHDYELDRALLASRRGIASFYSERDWVFLGAGTTVYGTMDGRHAPSAGHVGFEVPVEQHRNKAYARLYQIAWQSEMEETGHYGVHLTSGARAFVRRYVAPLVVADSWSDSLVQAVARGRDAP